MAVVLRAILRAWPLGVPLALAFCIREAWIGGRAWQIAAVGVIGYLCGAAMIAVAQDQTNARRK